jgi:hypothetical protein
LSKHLGWVKETPMTTVTAMKMDSTREIRFHLEKSKHSETRMQIRTQTAKRSARD